MLDRSTMADTASRQEWKQHSCRACLTSLSSYCACRSHVGCQWWSLYAHIVAGSHVLCKLTLTRVVPMTGETKLVGLTVRLHSPCAPTL